MTSLITELRPLLTVAILLVNGCLMLACSGTSQNRSATNVSPQNSNAAPPQNADSSAPPQKANAAEVQEKTAPLPNASTSTFVKLDASNSGQPITRPSDCKGEACEFLETKFTTNTDNSCSVHPGNFVCSIDVTNNGPKNMAFAINMCDFLGVCSWRYRVDVPKASTRRIQMPAGSVMAGYKNMVALFRKPQH